MSDHIDQLVSTLSLDEQVALLAGLDFWHTVPVEHAKIPTMRVTDGPIGARGTRFGGGPRSLAGPCGTLLAATWDVALVKQVGEMLGRETRSKGARVLLAPTINLHRTPIGGRNFECLSEDPHLTARTAVAYIQGLQSQGVASCVKHFVGNDTEFERMSIDSRIDERTLREMYLAPFEAAVKEAGVLAVMTSYNRINGPFAADSGDLINGVLRGEWGFDGLVMSDWYGLHSTVDALRAGLDLEMPGPTLHRGQKLVDAVNGGLVDGQLVRTAAANVLRLMDRVGAFEDGGPGPETTSDSADDIALIRSAAACGMVLLRNVESALPLVSEGLGRVAVLGPNAAVGQAMGGGSAHVDPTEVLHPLQSLSDRLASTGVEVVYGAGCDINKRLPEIEPRLCGAVSASYFNDSVLLDVADEIPVKVEPATLRMMWVKDPTDQGSANPRFGARLSTSFTPDVSGLWTFGLESVGPSQILIDRAVLLDNTEVPAGGSFFGAGKGEVTASIELEAGHAYQLDIEVRHHPTGMGMGGVNVGAKVASEGDLLAEAVELAAASDCSVLVVGTNDDWECEGWDRTTIDLPGAQDELIRRVAAVSKRTIVIINAGSPVAMPWLNEVDAVVIAWFPGQQIGESITDLLFGDVEPQGRLPVTFPVVLEDTPAFEHYPGRNGVANYLEGRLVGYRWYDTVGREPLFPFGFGLGYAQVEITGARRSNGSTIEVDLVNSSDRDGVQVVQVYAARVGAAGQGGDEPVQQLVGFAKAPVPGRGSSTVSVTLDPRAMQTWSVDAHDWVVADGPFELRIGTSSRHVAVVFPTE
jgi:beta-glucosidase